MACEKCDSCCKHDKGWWKLEEHYGDDNGKLGCKAGCGKVTDDPVLEELKNKNAALAKALEEIEEIAQTGYTDSHWVMIIEIANKALGREP